MDNKKIKYSYPAECKICNKNVKDIYKHIYIVHERRYRVECPKCNKTFRQDYISKHNCKKNTIDELFKKEIKIKKPKKLCEKCLKLHINEEYECI